MHSIINDFAWVAVGLVFVAFLFVLGAAYIFLDEGIRTLIRNYRKPADIPGSQSAGSNPAGLNASSSSTRQVQGQYRPLVPPRRATIPDFWRNLQSKIHQAKSGTIMRRHIGHRKPANAKS